MPSASPALRLIRSDNVGAVTFRDLINHFGSATGGARRACPNCPGVGAARIRLCPRQDAEAELEAALPSSTRTPYSPSSPVTRRPRPQSPHRRP